MKIITTLSVLFSLIVPHLALGQEERPVPHELISAVNTRYMSCSSTIRKFIDAGRDKDWQYSPGHNALLESLREYQSLLSSVRKTAEKSPGNDDLIKKLVELDDQRARSIQLMTFIKLPSETETMIQLWQEEVKAPLLPELKHYNERLISYLKIQEEKERTEIARRNEKELAAMRSQLAYAESQRNQLAAELAREQSRPDQTTIIIQDPHCHPHNRHVTQSYTPSRPAPCPPQRQNNPPFRKAF